MADMTIDEVKEKVSKGLEYARWKLLEKFPFTGEMLLRFSIVPTYDCRIDTAATDGTKIYFDCEFYSTLTEGQREFVLAHEVWHNIFLHFMRQKMREQGLWNIATDMEINHMLKNEGLDVLPNCCFPPPEVAGLNAEDIYAYLMKEQQNQSKNGGSSDSDDDSNGNGDGGSSDNQNDDDDGSESKGSSGSKSKSKTGGKDGGGKPTKGGSSGKSKYGNQFDKHLYEGDGPGDGEKQEGKWGEKGYDSNFNPSMKDVKEIEEKIKDMVCSVAQSIERKQGHLPAGVKSIVEEMLKPEINWKEALSQFVTKCLGGEHSWRRVSRHALGRGHYLPGRTDEKIKLACAVDTSGSYLQDLPKFLGELNSLLASFGKYEITLIQCDAAVQEVKEYDDSNPIDVKKFQVKGGGGTSFKPVFKYLREHGDDYNCVVYFTDGWGDAPNNPPPYPTLWMISANGGTKDFCDWGEKYQFKSNEK